LTAYAVRAESKESTEEALETQQAHGLKAKERDVIYGLATFLKFK
jgi:hypothetical protein